MTLWDLTGSDMRRHEATHCRFRGSGHSEHLYLRKEASGGRWTSEDAHSLWWIICWSGLSSFPSCISTPRQCKLSAAHISRAYSSTPGSEPALWQWQWWGASFRSRPQKALHTSGLSWNMSSSHETAWAQLAEGKEATFFQRWAVWTEAIRNQLASPAELSVSPAENRGSLLSLDEPSQNCQPSESWPKRKDIVLGQQILEWFVTPQ